MKYYFDTSVWIAYFDKSEFYHEEAVLWFEKVKGQELYTSDLVDKEMRTKPSVKQYSAISGKLCLRSVIEKEDLEHAKLLSRRYSMPYEDMAHILHAKRNGFIAVSADITHWPEIAKLLDFQSFYYISEIYPL